MPQTYRSYPILEASICLFHGGTLESGHRRSRRGDVVNIREMSKGTGLSVPKRYLFVPIYGFDIDEMYRFTDTIEAFEKRRYSIPLARIKQNYPALDMNKLLDQDEMYQPFILTDPNTGLFHGLNIAPFPAQGLIFDKKVGKYI